MERARRLARGTGLLVGIVGVTTALTGQDRTGRGAFTEVEVNEKGYPGMIYRVFVPLGVAKHGRYPLVFALHGDAQPAESLVQLLAQVSTIERPVFVVAPQYQRKTSIGMQLFQGAGAVFSKILGRMLRDHPIDPGRVVLQGHAMGSNYATKWLDHLRVAEPKRRLPFRGVWLHSTVVPPRRLERDLDFLLFVGARQPGIEDVRVAYRRMFTLGFEARYLELPDRVDAFGPECRRRMREHLAEWHDHCRALPAKFAEIFPAVRHSCMRGEFGVALTTLAAVTSGSDAKKKSKARAARGKIVGYLRGLASAAARSRKPDLLLFTRLEIVASSLGAHPKHADTIRKTLIRIRPKLESELRARDAFGAARTLSQDNWQASSAAMGELAEGSLSTTVYGRRARTHLRAIDSRRP